MLTKIGDGIQLSHEEQRQLEARFRSRQYCDENLAGSIRLFHRNVDVTAYNNRVPAQWQVVARDTYTGAQNESELASARNKVHKLNGAETLNMPYLLPLALNQPYMLGTNLDVNDRLVNGAIGFLRHVEVEHVPSTSHDTANSDRPF